MKNIRKTGATLTALFLAVFIFTANASAAERTLIDGHKFAVFVQRQRLGGDHTAFADKC